jgi:hypothetical protein
MPVLRGRLSSEAPTLSGGILVLLPEDPPLIQLETLVNRGFWVDLALEAVSAAAAWVSGRRLMGTFHILIYNNRYFE